MRASAIVSTAVLATLSCPAEAQDYSALQRANTSVLIDLVGYLKTRNVSAIEGLDPVIDYAPDNFANSTIAPERMVAMFKRCKPAPIDDAQRFSDTTILDFTCPGRKVEGACSTGDLRIMIYRQSSLSLGVIERQRIGANCKVPAPPALPSQPGAVH